MTGKIFPASANVYEDQAQILFEYFRQASEAIVGEEEALEKKLSVARERLEQLREELKKQGLREKVAYAVAIFVFLLGFALFFLKALDISQAIAFSLICSLAAGGVGLSFMMKCKKLSMEGQETSQEIMNFEQAFKEIRRNYQVRKLGLAYIPVAGQIAFEGKSFLVDHTETVPNQEFRLLTVRRSDLFTSTINDLESLIGEIPIVEKSTEMEEVATDQYSRSIQKISYYDYLGDLDRKLRTTAFCLEDLESTGVELPVIFPTTDYAAFLAEYGTTTIGNEMVFNCFNTNKYNDELETFRNLNEMKKSLERHAAQFEEVLRALMTNVANTVQAVTQLKMASTHKMVEHSNRLLFKILQAPYNHYSPKLEADEIERIRNESFDYQDSVDNYQVFQLKASSRVLYDPVSDIWVAEDGSKTAFPFGMQQIHEEIIAPIIQNLMQETRVERLKIYNGIKDQKINYLNQWHQDTEDFYGRNRAESNDLINQMRSSFTEFIASYNALSALQSTEQAMAASGSLRDANVNSATDGSELVAAYQIKAHEYQTVQEDFMAYMERLKEDIDRRAEKFGFIQYFDASLRDGSAKSFSESSSRAGDIDDRRKPLLAVNPFYAEVSELPPEPLLEELTAEHCSLNLHAIARQSLSRLDKEAAQAMRAPDSRGAR